MEKFYTPRDVERKFGIERNTLANWRANLIGPACIRWKGKILYHARDIEEWFKFEGTDVDTKSKKKPKKKAATEKESEAPPEPDPQPEQLASQKPKLDIDLKYLTPMKVSEKFDITHKTLANWRSEGRGPAYHKLGKQIRYPTDKLEDWFSRNEVKRYQRKGW